MFHIRDENDAVNWGFNFYPLSSQSSFGFVFKYSTHKAVMCRYSKIKQNFYIRLLKANE